MNEERLKNAFGMIKQDMESVKNELAFLSRRIAKIEESLNRQVLQDIKNEISKNKKKKQ